MFISESLWSHQVSHVHSRHTILTCGTGEPGEVCVKIARWEGTELLQPDNGRHALPISQLSPLGGQQIVVLPTTQHNSSHTVEDTKQHGLHDLYTWSDISNFIWIPCKFYWDTCKNL